MISTSILPLAMLTVACVCVYAYPNGAPLSRCGDMMPKHGAAPSKASPYFIKAVKSGDIYNVKITSNTSEPLKGFIIEAREDKDNAATTFGEWTSATDRTQLLDCFDKAKSAVTHSGKLKGVSEIDFQWKPTDRTVTNVTFIATVVRSYAKFYVGITETVTLH